MSSVTLIRGSLDHTFVQLNPKIIVHQMIQDPLTVSHQQRVKWMFDGKFNTQREDSIFSDAVSSPSWLEHCFHLDHWMQEFPNGCYSIPGVLGHTYLSAHFSRPPHCQISLADRISRTHDCKKMFQAFQTLTFCVEQLDRIIRSGVLCQSTQ